MKRTVAMLSIVVTAALLPACSSSGKPATSASSYRTAVFATAPATASTFDLDASLTIIGPYSTGVDAMTIGAPCIGIESGTTDYEDLAAGAPVTVNDGTGAVVGTGTLAAGTLNIVTLAHRACRFDITVTGVEGGKGFYSLTIGDHDTPKMKEADFRAGPSFTLDGS